MLISTSQAAEKLNITRGAVLAYVKKGALTDHATQRPGAKRHYIKLEQKEVNAFKKVYVPHTHRNGERFLAAQTATNGNGHSTSVPVPVSPRRPAVPEPVGLSTRLDAIEQKLDALIRMWS